MEYNLKEHGDPLEQTFADFIRTHFRTYEEVWKIYIGNKGNDIRAEIKSYPAERELKRQKFSEHTYTILQSLVSLQRLIDKDIFSKGFVNSVDDILDLQDNLMLFFTHLGRIRDNVQEASTCLLNHNEAETTGLLDEFYHKRHLVVHGKAIPIILKPGGEISLPVLSTNTVDVSGWYHKLNSWQDAAKLPNETVANTISKLYWDLLPKIEEVFGKFKKKIAQELNDGGYKLEFENKQFIGQTRIGSGSINPNAVSVYGIENIHKKNF